MLFDIWFLQLHCQVFHILASTRPESQTTMVCSLHDKNIMDGFIFGSRFRQKNFILTTSDQNTKNLDKVWTHRVINGFQNYLRSIDYDVFMKNFDNNSFMCLEGIILYEGQLHKQCVPKTETRSGQVFV